jgi:hypothetical protein
MCLNETYGKIRRGKHLSVAFPLQNGQKQGEALSPLRFNFDLQYINRKAQENKEGMELNGTDQILVYGDNDNLLSENINITKENRKLHQTLVRKLVLK